MRWLLVLGIVLASCGLLWAGTTDAPHAAALSQAFLYHHIDPIVVFKGDEDTTQTVEVATTGEAIASVRLTRPSEAIMHDDGTHGDAVAGDGIYTLEGVEHRTGYSNLGYGGTHSTSGRFKVVIERTDGSQEEWWLGIGIVDSEQQLAARKIADGVYATPYAVFMVDPFGVLLNVSEWPLSSLGCGRTNFEVFEKLYAVYPDSFDFVIVMPAHPLFDPTRGYAENTPYFVRAKNDVQRIGMDLFDNTDDFSSAGRLRGMIYHSWGTGQILDHEIGHAWAADIGEGYELTRCPDCYGNHWNPLSDIAGQMAAFLFHPDAELGAGHLMANGDGTWRIERESGDDCPFSMLDLYVMGLAPPEDVPPIHVLVNPDTSDHERVTAESVETYTIEDIMALEGGERIPAYGKAPKHFDVAFVVVGPREFTAAEYAFYSLIPKYFASTHRGDDALTTFHHATGGHGSLNARLPQIARQVSGRAGDR